MIECYSCHNTYHITRICLSLSSTPPPMRSLRSFSTNPTTKFKPAVAAAANLRRKFPPPKLPPPTPSARAPREGPNALTMGFGGAKPSYSSPSAGPSSSSSGKSGGKGKTREDKDQVELSESADLFTRVVHVGRVSRMTGTGRKTQYRALVIIGNGRGTGGFGVGKGANSKEALASAIKEGEKDLVNIDISPWGSLYHDVEGYCNSTKFIVKSIPSHKIYSTGGRLSQAIMCCMGISLYSCTIIGRRNPFSIVNAAFDALGHHRTPREVAELRGRKLVDLGNPTRYEAKNIF